MIHWRIFVSLQTVFNVLRCRLFSSSRTKFLLCKRDENSWRIRPSTPSSLNNGECLFLEISEHFIPMSRDKPPVEVRTRSLKFKTRQASVIQNFLHNLKLFDLNPLIWKGKTPMLVEEFRKGTINFLSIFFFCKTVVQNVQWLNT